MPVFVKREDKRIEIFDFFAGAGYDSGGNPGSPIITILDELNPYCEQFKINYTEVNLAFNDTNKRKFNILQHNANSKFIVCAERKKHGFFKNASGLNYNSHSVKEAIYISCQNPDRVRNIRIQTAFAKDRIRRGWALANGHEIVKKKKADPTPLSYSTQIYKIKDIRPRYSIFLA